MNPLHCVGVGNLDIWSGYRGVNSCQCCKSCHQRSTTVPIVPYTNASNQTVCNEKLEKIYRTYSKWNRIGLQYILSYGICNRQTSWGMQSANRGINAIGKPREQRNIPSCEVIYWDRRWLHYYHIWESRLLSSSRKSSFVCLLLFLTSILPTSRYSVYILLYVQSIRHGFRGLLHLNYYHFRTTSCSKTNRNADVENQNCHGT